MMYREAVEKLSKLQSSYYTTPVNLSRPFRGVIVRDSDSMQFLVIGRLWKNLEGVKGMRHTLYYMDGEVVPLMSGVVSESFHTLLDE